MVCRRSVGQSHMGHAGRRCQRTAAFTSSPCPSPGRGFRLSVALWRVPAVTPLVYTASREPVRREGDKSLKLYPCERLTFNRAKWAAGDRIGARRAEYPRWIAYSPPRKPSEIPPSGGFRFLDDEPNKSIMPPKFCGGAIHRGFLLFDKCSALPPTTKCRTWWPSAAWYEGPRNTQKRAGFPHQDLRRAYGQPAHHGQLLLFARRWSVPE